MIDFDEEPIPAASSPRSSPATFLSPVQPVAAETAALARRAAKYPLLPVKDPLLGDSLAFENF